MSTSEFLHRRTFVRLFSVLGVSWKTNAATAKATSFFPVDDVVKAVPPQPTTTTTGTLVGDWDLYSNYSEGPTSSPTDFIQTIDFTLSSGTVGTGSDVAVIADTITIVGQVSLPGRNVLLVARQITFAQGSSIDCSGANGVAQEQRADDGKFAGDNGSEGAQGGAGHAGGNISIYARQILGLIAITSNGGNGSKGQSGGWGITGAQGATGDANSPDHAYGGYTGRKGGTGGTGGVGGDAGDSGRIDIGYVVPLTTPASVNATAGGTGPNGDPGKPGGQGPGGDGGVYVVSGVGHVASRDRTGKTGDLGPAGDPAPPQTKVAKSGVTTPPTTRQTPIETIARWASATQLRMLIQSATLSFLNNAVSSLSPQLQWAVAIAKSQNAGGDLQTKRAAWNAPDIPRAVIADEWSNLYQTARTMLRNYRSGLNAFGYSPDYVSQLSFDFLRTQANQFIASAAQIESSHQKWLDQKNSLDARRQSLSEAMATLKTNLEALHTEASTQASLADKTQDEIQRIDAQLDQLQNQLAAAQQAFQKAVDAKQSCNSFLNMIKFVTAVVQIAKGAYNGIVDLGDVLEDADAFTDDDANIITRLTVLEQTFEDSDVVKDFTAMQQGFKALEANNTEANQKLVVSLESFESQLKPFLDLKEAVAYRDLLRTFVDVTKTRNDKQLAYTQAKLKAQAAVTQAAKLQLNSDQTSTILAESNNPALIDEEQFLSDYLQSAKLWILDVLDLMRRALAYQVLSSTQITLNYRDMKVADLQTMSDTISAQWLKAINEMQNAGQATQFSATRVVLDFASQPTLKTQLMEKGELVFTIPSDHPAFNRAGTSFMKVTEVALDLTNVRSQSNVFTSSLAHLGSSILVNSDGRKMTFSHNSRLVNLEYDFTGGRWAESGNASTSNNLGIQDSYAILLSPFTTWLFKVFPDTKVDWRTVDKLVFVFKGNFIPRNVGFSDAMFKSHVQRLTELNHRPSSSPVK